MTVSHDSDNMKVVSIGENDVFFTSDEAQSYTATSLYEALAVQSVVYGDPIAGSLEKYDLNSESYVACSDTGTLSAGEYRISFKIEGAICYAYTVLK